MFQSNAALIVVAGLALAIRHTRDSSRRVHSGFRFFKPSRKTSIIRRERQADGSLAVVRRRGGEAGDSA